MTELDFIGLKERFDRNLTNGQRAEIRRALDPDSLSFMGSLYRLVPKGVRPDERWRRTIFFLPYIKHAEDGGTLGASLTGISEVRIFQMARSHYPNDLIQLRRICRHAEPASDWNKAGNMLFYWGRAQKRRLVEDYFYAVQNVETENE